MTEATPVDTRHLIDRLATHASPVRPLASPLRRATRWLLLAVLVVCAVTAAYGVRPDFMATLRQPLALLEWVSSLLTGVLAAIAAFQVSVPGRSPRWAWVPLPAFVAWVSTISAGCVLQWLQAGGAALVFQAEHRDCAEAITLISVPIGLVMLFMLRHAGLYRPRATALLGALAAASLASAGVSLFHRGESAAMVLLWHVGAVAVLALLSAVGGRRMFGWMGFRERR